MNQNFLSLFHPSSFRLHLFSTMRYTLKVLFILSTGLWLGGMLMALTILFTFFAKDRNLAVQVGPTLILTFEKFQAIFGVIALFTFVGWRLMVCSKPKKIIMPLILIAAAGATVSTAFITPRVNALWFSGQGGTPEFWKWHGISQVIYLIQTACLLATIALTPWAIDCETSRAG